MAVVVGMNGVVEIVVVGDVVVVEGEDVVPGMVDDEGIGDSEGGP